MGKKVLVIDDASSVRESVGFILSEAGFEVEEAGDGEEARSSLAASCIIRDTYAGFFP